MDFFLQRNRRSSLRNSSCIFRNRGSGDVTGMEVFQDAQNIKFCLELKVYFNAKNVLTILTKVLQTYKCRNSPPGVFLGKFIRKYVANLQEITHAEVQEEYLWRADSVNGILTVSFMILLKVKAEKKTKKIHDPEYQTEENLFLAKFMKIYTIHFSKFDLC